MEIVKDKIFYYKKVKVRLTYLCDNYSVTFYFVVDGREYYARYDVEQMNIKVVKEAYNKGFTLNNKSQTFDSLRESHRSWRQ